MALGLGVLLALAVAGSAAAHGLGGKDAAFVAATQGPDPVPFLYLGAKHMVTGYDHLLFILGVIFFLYRMRDVGLYVTLFSVGHSLTLLAGVLGGISVNAYLVDAVIGLSVAY
ncbi:MAG: HupE/UreJ family protein, partial [bacterium]|nr:HupE/UreJ family protein [bacterium]